MTSLLQHDHPLVKRRADSLEEQAIATTVITVFEQLQGGLAVINRARNAAQLMAAFELLLETHGYFCTNIALPFDFAAAAVYRQLVAQRLHIGTQDLRIAAIALANDATLVTGNRRDFERVPELRLEDWTVA